jgi:hypothetical protein
MGAETAWKPQRLQVTCAVMTAEEKERFEELQDQITEYAKQIAELKEALQIAIRFTHPNVVTLARQYGKGRGVQGVWANVPTSAEETAFQEKCVKFVEKYSAFEAK